MRFELILSGLLTLMMRMTTEEAIFETEVELIDGTQWLKGARQESQIRFAFFLKGIGSLGTIRRPGSPF